jgi:hypothetical protein
MIIHCNYEELHALAAGAELILDPFSMGTGGVAAPMQAVTQVAMLQPRLTESLSIATLEEQRWVRRAVDAICTALHERMDERSSNTIPPTKRPLRSTSSTHTPSACYDDSTRSAPR